MVLVAAAVEASLSEPEKRLTEALRALRLTSAAVNKGLLECRRPTSDHGKCTWGSCCNPSLLYPSFFCPTVFLPCVLHILHFSLSLLCNASSALMFKARQK